jgi:hypothetical protein
MKSKKYIYVIPDKNYHVKKQERSSSIIISEQTNPNTSTKKLRSLIWCVKKATKVDIESKKHMDSVKKLQSYDIFICK